MHLAGLYFLWVSILIIFGKRIPTSAGYVLPVALLLAALAFRLWPQRRELQLSATH
jgi:lipopolysaccharide export LptBFGC system permease protein LptF